MTNIIGESTFEDAIIDSLIKNGGYAFGDSKEYDPKTGLFKNELMKFLQESQEENWEKISSIHGADVNERVIQRLCREMEIRGSFDVIRKGFTDYGVVQSKVC